MKVNFPSFLAFFILNLESKIIPESLGLHKNNSAPTFFSFRRPLSFGLSDYFMPASLVPESVPIGSEHLNPS